MVLVQKLLEYYNHSVGAQNPTLEGQARKVCNSSPEPAHAVRVRNMVDDMAEKTRVGLTFNRSVTESIYERWCALEDLNVQFLEDVKNMGDKVADEMSKIERHMQSFVFDRTQVLMLSSKLEQMAGLTMHITFYKTILEAKMFSMENNNVFLQKCTESLGFTKPTELIDRYRALKGIFEEIYSEFVERSNVLNELQERYTEILEHMIKQNMINYNKMADMFEQLMTIRSQNTDIERFIQGKLDLSSSTAVIVYKLNTSILQIYTRLMAFKRLEPVETDPYMQLQEISSRMALLDSVVQLAHSMLLAGSGKDLPSAFRRKPRKRRRASTSAGVSAAPSDTDEHSDNVAKAGVPSGESGGAEGGLAPPHLQRPDIFVSEHATPGVEDGRGSRGSGSPSPASPRFWASVSIDERERERSVRDALARFADILDSTADRGEDGEDAAAAVDVKRNTESIFKIKTRSLARLTIMSGGRRSSVRGSAEAQSPSGEDETKGTAEAINHNVNRPLDTTCNAALSPNRSQMSLLPPLGRGRGGRVGGPSSGRRVQATPPRDMSDNRRSKVANTNRPLRETVSGSSMEVNRIPPLPETVGKSRGAATRWARSNGTRDPTKTRRPVADITERGSRLRCLSRARSLQSLETIPEKGEPKDISGGRRGDGGAGVNLPSIQRGGESSPRLERCHDCAHTRGRSFLDQVMAEARVKMTSPKERDDDQATSAGVESPLWDTSPEGSGSASITDLVQATHETAQAPDRLPGINDSVTHSSHSYPRLWNRHRECVQHVNTLLHGRAAGGVSAPGEGKDARPDDRLHKARLATQPSWEKGEEEENSKGSNISESYTEIEARLAAARRLVRGRVMPPKPSCRPQGPTQVISKQCRPTMRRLASQQRAIRSGTVCRRDPTLLYKSAARKASGVADAKCAGPSKQQSWVAGPRGFLPSVPPRPKHAAPVTLGKTRALAPATGNMPTTTSASSGKSHKPAVLKSGVSESVGPKSKNIRSLVSRSNLPATSPGRVELGSRSSAGQASTLESRRVLSQVCQSRRYLRANCLSILAGVNLRSRGSAPSMDIPPGQGQESDMLKCLNHSTPRT